METNCRMEPMFVNSRSHSVMLVTLWCWRGIEETNAAGVAGTAASRVPPWFGADNGLLTGYQATGDDRGGGPRAHDAAGRLGTGPLVTVSAAALHRVGARGAPATSRGAAALARQAAAVAPGRRPRRRGGVRTARNRAARGERGDRPDRPGARGRTPACGTRWSARCARRRASREHEHADLRYVLATGSPDAIAPENEQSPLRWLSVDAARELVGDNNLRHTLDRLDELFAGGR